MRYNLRLSLSVPSLLLALLVPSILVMQAAHSHPAGAPDLQLAPGRRGQRPAPRHHHPLTRRVHTRLAVGVMA